MPVTRARADKMIQALPDRAKQLNADPRYRHRISRMAVFGSYLTDKSTLGDLDLAVDYSVRRSGWSDEDRDKFEAAFPPPDYIKRDFFNRLFWPEARFIRDLRVGNGLRVHEFSELLELDCPYRMIFEADGPDSPHDVGVNEGGFRARCSKD